MKTGPLPIFWWTQMLTHGRSWSWPPGKHHKYLTGTLVPSDGLWMLRPVLFVSCCHKALPAANLPSAECPRVVSRKGTGLKLHHGYIKFTKVDSFAGGFLRWTGQSYCRLLLSLKKKRAMETTETENCDIHHRHPETEFNWNSWQTPRSSKIRVWCLSASRVTWPRALSSTEFRDCSILQSTEKTIWREGGPRNGPKSSPKLSFLIKMVVIELLFP